MVSDGFRWRFPAVELILFDAVGTVLTPRRPVAEVYHEYGERFGSQRTRNQIRDRFHWALQRNAGRAIQPSWEGRPVRVSPWLRANTNESRELRRWHRIVADVFDDVPDRAGELFFELWQHFAQAEAWEVHPDWSETQTTLQRLGLQVGIASNFDQRLLHLAEELHPLKGLRHLFVSSRLGVSKPDPRFYQAIERQTGFGGPSILLIGDDPLHDVIAPRQAGWQALWWSPNEQAVGMKNLPRLRRFSDLIRFSPCDE
jgi:putative hydrolase of the HAD superfamily